MEEGKKFKIGTKVTLIDSRSYHIPVGIPLTVKESDHGWFRIVETGPGWYPGPYNPDVFKEWAEAGPVRTVTRKEIVPGEYARVHVVMTETEPLNPDVTRRVGVMLASDANPTLNRAMLTATELRAAAAVLIELAGALEGNGK